MSVKIIETNARGFLYDAIRRLEELHQKIIGLIPWTINSEIREQKKSLDAFIPELRKFHDSDLFWNECLEKPALFNENPITLSAIFNRKIKGKMYVFKNAFILVNGIYSENEGSLLVVSYVNKHRSQAEHLVMRENAKYEGPYERRRISEEVRSEVWRRDGAKCVKCSSIYNLEFDHIIPISRGGSNTARNLQLLCENCNRSKSNKI